MVVVGDVGFEAVADGAGLGVWVGADGAGLGVWVGADGVVLGVCCGTGPMAGALGAGSGVTADAVSRGAGSASAEGGPVIPVSGTLGLSGPHDGPMFGTGGGVSNIGSIATGPSPVAGSGAGMLTGSWALPATGAASEGPGSASGAGSAVVLASGAFSPDGTLAEEAVPSGTVCVAGRSWLEAATHRASAPASTIAAGAASFFTITPRMLDAPRYGRGSTCPGTIIPWGGPDNASGIWCMGYF